MLALQARDRSSAGRARRRARASSRSPGGPTSASRRSSTRSSGARSRSSPTSRRRRGARSAASPRAPERWQLVLTDLPGVQRPRDALTERMQRRVEHELARGRRRAVRRQRRAGRRRPRRPLHRRGAARAAGGAGRRSPSTRSTGSTARTVAALQAAADLGPRRGGLPGLGAHRARRARARRAPRRAAARGPVLLPAPRRSPTSPSGSLLAELVREQVLRRTRQEVPHAVEVAGRGESSRGEPDRRARAAVGGDRVPEGHPDRQPAGA